MVASFLSLKDTKNFRRSSKAFSDIGARYLMVDTVTLTPHHRPGQNMLEDVGKNDVLRRYIKNLRIDTRQFSPLDSYEE